MHTYTYKRVRGGDDEVCTAMDKRYFLLSDGFRFRFRYDVAGEARDWELQPLGSTIEFCIFCLFVLNILRSLSLFVVLPMCACGWGTGQLTGTGGGAFERASIRHAGMPINCQNVRELLNRLPTVGLVNIFTGHKNGLLFTNLIYKYWIDCVYKNSLVLNKIFADEMPFKFNFGRTVGFLKHVYAGNILRINFLHLSKTTF